MGLELAGQVGSVSIEISLLGKYTWQFEFFLKQWEKKNNIPKPGIEPGPRRWERRILTTRPCGRCIADTLRNFICGVKNFSFSGWKLTETENHSGVQQFTDHL